MAVFAAASEAFSRRNINCSIAESLARFEPVVAAARAAGVAVRGYVSCAVGCPYQVLDRACMCSPARQACQLGAACWGRLLQGSKCLAQGQSISRNMS